jgi:RNA polymerase sigma-70 factor (ECF subfamily)
MARKTDTNSTPADTSRFATTHWSVVLAARSPESTRYQEALEILCQTYWYPLFAFLRRKGHDVHQAEDCIQGFFASLLEKQGLRLADSDRGKFRSYLLGALKHYVADERNRTQAQKRGGGCKVFPLDVQLAEDQYAPHLVSQYTPEKLFERSWALTVLKGATNRLEAEWATADKKELFKQLIVFLAPTNETMPYRDMASKLNMSEGAVKTTVYRMRKRYRELLHNEIAQTVSSKEDVEDELQELFTAFST